MLQIMKIFTLEARLLFVVEKWTKPYIWYGAGNLADKNSNLAQEPSGADSFAGWQAGAV